MQHYFTLLRQQMKEHWDVPALCNYKGDEFTYRDLAENIEKFHLFFEALGIGKGDKIAVCARNSACWAIAFLATNTYGAVAVPILSDFLPSNINYLVNHSDSSVLFTDPDIWQKLDISLMPQLKIAISVKDFSIIYRSEDICVPDSLDILFSEKYHGGFTVEDVNYPTDNLGDIAVINYTSGTTSAPKGVMIRYESLSSNVNFGISGLPVVFGDKMVSMLPQAHMYGLMFELLYPICAGARVYYLGKTPTPTILLGAMKDVKPYAVVSVPLVMEKIFKSSIQPVLRKPFIKPLLYIPGICKLVYRKIYSGFMEAFGGNVRMFILGGAALNPTVEYWFKKIGIPYTVGYGMTEASPLLAYENPAYFVMRSCGKAVERCEIRIDSEDPENVVGEIQARGMNIMSGYYKNESATAAAFTSDGWMKTGDLGVIDSQGNVFIRGRSKNMILTSNGQNVYPEELEAIVNEQPFVIESIVLERDGKIVALVYPDRKHLEEDAIDQHLEMIRTDVNRQLPSYSRISRIEAVDAPFEKTPKLSIKRFLYK